MLLSDVACVLADTSRSQAYIQALVRNGLYPAKCLIMADGALRTPSGGQENSPFFDMGESILETLTHHRMEYEVIPAKDVNGGEMECAIRNLPQRYLIYSGYGGCILKPHLFQMEKKWLHVHAGLLPQYRGSTTAYYSLLAEGMMGATAIFLNEKIDEGNVIAEEVFPPPEQGELVDYVYDPYIRSCVLVKAVKAYLQNGIFMEHPQGTQNAETYHIIHPVLKHIAILGLDHDGER